MPGLAYTSTGGDILFIEATKMPGKKLLELTGQLGDVMKESVKAAMSYLQSHGEELGIAQSQFDNCAAAFSTADNYCLHTASPRNLMCDSGFWRTDGDISISYGNSVSSIST